MQRISEFNYTYRELAEVIDSEEAAELSEAGGHIISEMGAYATVMQLVERYGQTMEYWFKKELEDVYRVLLLNHRESKVKHNLSKIKKRKAEIENKKK